MNTKTKNEQLVNNSNHSSNQNSSINSPKEFLEKRMLELDIELKKLVLSIEENNENPEVFNHLVSEHSLVELDYIGCEKELELIRNGDKDNGFVFDIENYSGKGLAKRMNLIYDKYIKDNQETNVK